MPRLTISARSRLVAATIADVDLDRLLAADALEPALLEHAQELGLQAERELADLVEEQRAADRPSRTGPAFFSVAPVNAPFSWPNSSLSIRLSVSAAQLTATHGPFARRLARWIARATISLPAPDSPPSSTSRRSGRPGVTNASTRLRRVGASDQLAVAGRPGELLLERVRAARPPARARRSRPTPRRAGATRQPIASESICSQAAPLRSTHSTPITSSPAPWTGAAISARPPRLGGHHLAVADHLVDQLLRDLELGRLAGARPTADDRRDAPARRQHERPLRAQRRERRIAGRAGDRLAPAGRLAAQAIPELRERREVTPRAIVGADQREQLPAVDLHRHVARGLGDRDAVDRQVDELGAAEDDLVACLEPVRGHRLAVDQRAGLAAVVDPRHRALAELDRSRGCARRSDR